MDRTSISRRIGSIKGDITKLSNTLCAIENTDVENYPDNYAMLTTDAALRSELIACRMRHLLYGSTTTRKETYLASAGVVQGIRINMEDGALWNIRPIQGRSMAFRGVAGQVASVSI